MATTHQPDDSTRWVRSLALTAVVCALAGWAGLQLAMTNGFASPLNPATGVALASVLIYGRRMLGGVAIAAFVVSTGVLVGRGQRDLALMGLPAVVALGAALQAWLGATLIRRHVRQPLTLNEPREVARFYAACAVASIVNASLSCLAMRVIGALPSAQFLYTWGTWWVGDLAGLLIATPIALTLIGRPRSDWVSRRLSVGLTLALVTTFLALGIVQAARWNTDRVRMLFADDASSALTVLASRLREPLNALEAMHGVFDVSADMTRSGFHTATRNWLADGDLATLGWAERVRRDELAGFEARTRGDGSSGYRVVDRPESSTLFEAVAGKSPGADASSPAPSRFASNDLMPVRLVEPLHGNASALGVNAFSVAEARSAIESTLQNGQPIATAGFSLARDAASKRGNGVLVFRAVYDGDPTTDAARRAALRGVVFVGLSIDAQVERVAAQFPKYLAFCVLDLEPTAARRRLSGDPDCDHRRAGLDYVRTLSFAGRPWGLSVHADPAALPGGIDRGTWVIAVVGLLSAAMLGASLLTVTGRTRRIESAVRDRTTALMAEVSERKVAEAALRDSEQRFRNIIDNVPIGVVYTDLPGRAIQANPRFCELIGYTEQELLTLGPLDYTHPDDVTEDAALTAQLVRGEISIYRRDKRYVAKHGTVVWVRSTVSLLRDAGAQPWRIVGVVEDITEHLQLEEAEHAREAAEASNRAKSEFLSRMSHELRTPLNAMLGFAQLLELDQRHPLAPMQRPWVTQIQEAGWHLLEMINDVLDLSRIESGNLRLHVETLDLPQLVASTLALIDSDARRRRITITQELGEGAGVLLGDATRVKQILTNMLSNAVKYNSEPGRVHVASRMVGHEMVEISVTDTGLGMTPEQMTELFKPFNRLGRERTALQGTGIGLVISQRLAELMGGKIRAKSAPGQGSSFILSLPKALDPDTVRSAFDEQAALSAPYHRRVVHYIEDNETNVEVMRGILAQRPQVDMRISVTGLDGLAAVRARLPDLILLDMHLPDISGMELLRHFRADPPTALIPVVVVSADALGEQIGEALAAGASHYLTKPVNIVELLGVIDGLLDSMETGFD